MKGIPKDFFTPTHKKTPRKCDRKWRKTLKGSEQNTPGELQITDVETKGYGCSEKFLVLGREGGLGRAH